MTKINLAELSADEQYWLTMYMNTNRKVPWDTYKDWCWINDIANYTYTSDQTRDHIMKTLHEVYGPDCLDQNVTVYDIDEITQEIIGISMRMPCPRGSIFETRKPDYLAAVKDVIGR